MEEDGENKERNSHALTIGNDANIKMADEEESGILKSETLEDLVDQMEIEISDHEDDKIDDATTEREDVATPEVGVVVERESSNNADNVQSRLVSSKDSIEGKGHATTRSDGQMESGEVIQRRRRLSQFERIEFRPISLDYQLSDDDIIELMELLQVKLNYDIIILWF